MTTKKIEANVHVAQTPTGDWGMEAPRVAAPSIRHDLFGYYANYIGNPIGRYGKRVLPTHVPTRVKLQMLKHPVIAMCLGFISATLVKAQREIRCRNAAKQRFFEALFRTWEQELMLQATVGIALGSLGLIKRWAFETPRPINTLERPVWNGPATPYIIKGFDPCYPTTSEPLFDDTRRVFKGIRVEDGTVDVFYALWLTFRQEWAFGAYEGAGRLDHAYNDWWMSEFSRDLYLVALQKHADKVTVVGYPPGKTADGQDNQVIALQVGDDVRSGATAAIPTDTYTNVDTVDGVIKPSAISRWSLQFLDAAADFSEFHEIDDHHAQRMSIGLFVPPQAYLNVKQSALGGPTTADVLTDLARELLMQDAATLDRHLNKYVFPAIARANFADDEPVEVETIGLAADNRDQLMEIVKALIGQHTDADYFDFREALEQLEFPLRSDAEVEAEREEKAEMARQISQGQAPGGQPNPDDGTPPTAPPAQPSQSPRAAAAEDEGPRPVGQPLPAWGDDEVPITAQDVAQALMEFYKLAPQEAQGILTAVTEEDESEAA